MDKKKPNFIEYMCTWCGHKTTKGINSGRPLPGKCPRRNSMPHRWVINRKF